jgi:hypothetical protein
MRLGIGLKPENRHRHKRVGEAVKVKFLSTYIYCYIDELFNDTKILEKYTLGSV